MIAPPGDEQHHMLGEQDFDSVPHVSFNGMEYSIVIGVENRTLKTKMNKINLKTGVYRKISFVTRISYLRSRAKFTPAQPLRAIKKNTGLAAGGF
jgi:hypothetical protein